MAWTESALATEKDLENFAAEQVARGEELWLDHQMRTGGGICASCGHVYPCEGAQHGAWLVLYWERYLATS
ncbi:MAG: hypothetical protein HOV79_17800 [Hamadaea sp.]|nr:hypothetical protein [Hamadaea sp.]